jgi:hypothetical protein
LELSDNYFLSLGENCLTDDVLNRHGLKSFSTPYSHGRTNIDYAIDLEKGNYTGLLDTEYLSYKMMANKRVVRNGKYYKSDPIFIDIHRNGFEFTHHDVISCASHRRSCLRKINRLKRYKGRKNIRFYYHYRMNAGRDMSLIFKKAEQFLSYYQVNSRRCTLTIFTQDIVSTHEDRDVIEVRYSDSIRAYMLKTLQVWAGDDQDEFWARNDDDLIEKMLSLSRH